MRWERGLQITFVCVVVKFVVDTQPQSLFVFIFARSGILIFNLCEDERRGGDGVYEILS